MQIGPLYRCSAGTAYAADGAGTSLLPSSAGDRPADPPCRRNLPDLFRDLAGRPPARGRAPRRRGAFCQFRCAQGGSQRGGLRRWSGSCSCWRRRRRCPRGSGDVLAGYAAGRGAAAGLPARRGPAGRCRPWSKCPGRLAACKGAGRGAQRRPRRFAQQLAGVLAGWLSGGQQGPDHPDSVTPEVHCNTDSRAESERPVEQYLFVLFCTHLGPGTVVNHIQELVVFPKRLATTFQDSCKSPVFKIRESSRRRATDPSAVPWPRSAANRCSPSPRRSNWAIRSDDECACWRTVKPSLSEAERPRRSCCASAGAPQRNDEANLRLVVSNRQRSTRAGLERPGRWVSGRSLAWERRAGKNLIPTRGSQILHLRPSGGIPKQ